MKIYIIIVYKKHYFLNGIVKYFYAPSCYENTRYILNSFLSFVRQTYIIILRIKIIFKLYIKQNLFHQVLKTDLCILVDIVFHMFYHQYSVSYKERKDITGLTN